MERHVQKAADKMQKATERVGKATERVGKAMADWRHEPKQDSSESGNAQHYGMAAGQSALDALSDKTGNMLLTNFVSQQLKSSKARRKHTSETASEVVQTLVIVQSRSMLEPVYAGLADLLNSFGAQVYKATWSVISDYVQTHIALVKETVLDAARLCRDVLDWCSPRKAKLLVQKHGPGPTLLLRVSTAAALYLLLRGLHRIGGAEAFYGLIIGGAAGSRATFCYYRNRAYRARLVRLLGSVEGTDLVEPWLTPPMEQALDGRVHPDGRICHKGVVWLNSILASLWPPLATHFGSLLMDTSNDLMAHFKPSFVTDMRVTRCELGNLPIDVRQMKINSENEEQLEFTFNVTWEGQVAIDLTIDAMKRQFHTQVRKLVFRGTFRVLAGPLVPVLPCFSAISVSLAKPPNLDFEVNVKTVVSPTPVVLWLKRFIRETIDDALLWPARIVIPLIPEDHPRMEPYIATLLSNTKGIVRVQVLKAESLYNEDVNLVGLASASDPYAIVDTSRAEFCATKTVSNNNNPEWNETYYLRMFELGRPLHVEVWDADVVDADDFLGRCKVRVDELKPGQTYVRFYELGREDFHSIGGTGRGFGRIKLGIKWWPLDLLRCNLGSGLVDTTRKDFHPSRIREVQHGCVFVYVVNCTGLTTQAPGAPVSYNAVLQLGDKSVPSSTIADSTGSPELIFYAQFYDVAVTETLLFKVYAEPLQSGSDKSKRRRLAGTLRVPLATPAVAKDGVISGEYALSGSHGGSVVLKIEWLPLDCNALPYPALQSCEHGSLSVHVDHAKDLINADTVGYSDPYVKLKIRKEQQTSSVKPNTLSPVWNEDFDFSDVSTSDSLHIEVMDKDRYNDDSLGQIFVPLQLAAKKCSEDARGIWLNTWNLSGVKTGSITLTLRWDPGHRFLDEGERQEGQNDTGAVPAEALPAKAGLLQRAIKMKHPSFCSEIEWHAEPVPPSIAPTGTVGYTSSGQDQDLAQAEIAPASDTAPADGHVPSMRRSNTARMWTDSPDKQVFSTFTAISQAVYWDLLVVLHWVKGILPDPQQYGVGNQQLAVTDVIHAELAIGNLQTESKQIKISKAQSLWAEGFVWHNVALDSDEDISITLKLSDKEGPGQQICRCSIPLTAVRASPGRLISGIWKVESSLPSGGTVSMALEAAFAHHRPLPRLDSARGNSGIRTGTVVAELHSAANLPAADLNGFSDPFCSLKVGSLRYLSSTVPSSLNPVWNETFKFHDVAEDGILHINVYDKDAARKELLGSVDVPIEEIAGCGGQLSDTFPLQGRNASGTVHLTMKWIANDNISSAPGSMSLSGLHAFVSTDQHEAGRLKIDLTSKLNKDLSGSFQVLLKSATELLPMDSNGLSDPYCTLKVAKQRHVSDVKYKTLSPTWGVMFTFDSVSPNDVLHINIWDKDTVSKDLMGTVDIPVVDVIDSTESRSEKAWSLTLDGSPAGLLDLAISWEAEPQSKTASFSSKPRASQQRGSSPLQLAKTSPVLQDITPATTSPPSPQSGKVANDALNHAAEGDHLYVRVDKVRSDVSATNTRDVFLSMKLGSVRRSASLQTQPALSNTIVWNETLLFPCTSDLSRAYLRIRLYQKLQFRKLRLGEVHIPLSDMVADSASGALQLSGPWHFSGGKETIDVSISSLPV